MESGGFAKIKYAVACDKHGKGHDRAVGKMVMMSAPKGKKDRKEAGCPHCKKGI